MSESVSRRALSRPLGANGYPVKPVTRSDLWGVLRRFGEKIDRISIVHDDNVGSVANRSHSAAWFTAGRGRESGFNCHLWYTSEPPNACNSLLLSFTDYVEK